MIINATKHHDMWPQIIQLLKSQGFSQGRLAERVGVDQSTICRLADGRAPEPRFSVGIALIDLAGGAEKLESEHGIKIGSRTLKGDGRQAEAAIQHVEAVAVAAIRDEASQATAEIKHVVAGLLEQGAAAAQPKEEEDWDEVTERRRLDAPPDRRISAASVARAEFIRSQQAAKQQGV